MDHQELEPVEIQGELKSTGTFLVDKKAMEKMVDEELFKIANEALLPYKVYLRYSVNILMIHFPGFLTGLSGVVFAVSHECTSAYFCLMVMSLMLTAKCFVKLLFDYTEHGCFFHPLYKLYLAKKIFGQVIKELHYEAMDNQADLKLMKEKFIYKVQEVKNRKQIAKETKKREKEEAEEKLQKLLSQAKYGLV